MPAAVRWAAWALAAGMLVPAAGCGGPALPRTYPVSGTVVYKNGQPMKGGSVQFETTADPLLRVVGDIGDDGTFRLRTLKDNARADGAPEGEYRVFVQPPLVNDPRGGLKVAHKGVPAIVLPQTYRVEAKENTLKIELPAAPK